MDDTVKYEGEERRVKVHWTLDRKVPLALILAIALQTTGVVWWAATLTSRINALETMMVEKTRDRIYKSEALQYFQVLQTQVNSNKESIGVVRERLSSIDKKLDRLIERKEQ